MAQINFFKEDTDFILKDKNKTRNWIKQTAKEEGYKVKEINYIFCNDEHLLQINKDYLNHDYYTDIITFDNSENGKIIEGDIFISVERIKENSQILKNEFDSELKRVIIHGILHLCGLKDKTPSEEQIMREKENHYLLKYN
jgi:probable rRNA maturation factor